MLMNITQAGKCQDARRGARRFSIAMTKPFNSTYLTKHIYMIICNIMFIVSTLAFSNMAHGLTEFLR
jgi:hypothetical protein